jgi:hypothetical protein
MKTLIVATSLIATNAMALDFDSEWAKFSNDFVKLRAIQIAKVERKPVDKPNEVLPIVEDRSINVKPLPEKNDTSELQQVDPKSPDRLGHKLSDPAVKDYVTKLYQKPDTVVYSATIR